nr:hemerythrin domain-containing protein [Breoghania sp. L-A4]
MVLTLDLNTRTGWPEDLRFLVDRYPRDTWQAHGNLGSMARFWLQRHDMFRELGGMLKEGTHAFREGETSADQFQAWLVPRLQFFLGQLHEHHNIEDHHYFPVFQAAEKRLARGFDVLESDHETIHQALAANADSANQLLGALHKSGDARRFAADRYADVSDALLGQLMRHLNDEEDLIIPLILDRGEPALGVG